MTQHYDVVESYEQIKRKQFVDFQNKPFIYYTSWNIRKDNQQLFK